MIIIASIIAIALISLNIMLFMALKRVDLLADQVIHTIYQSKHTPVSSQVFPDAFIADPHDHEPVVSNFSTTQVEYDHDVITDYDEYLIEKERLEKEQNRTRVTIQQAREGLLARGIN